MRGSHHDLIDAKHGNLGDDFHVEHHLKPARHWSTYREASAKETAAHQDGHRALVVEKGFYSPLGMMRALWTRDYAGFAARSDMRGLGGDLVEEQMTTGTRFKMIIPGR